MHRWKGQGNEPSPGQGHQTAEAILKRFNPYNVTHPTYKALAELGKVDKTIYLGEYLSSIDLRYEVQEGLNVVERWNEANDFVHYGRQASFFEIFAL